MHKDSGTGCTFVRKKASLDDIQAILQIDASYSPKMLDGKWKERDFRQCVRDSDIDLVVSKADGVVVGYMAVGKFDRTFEVYRIAVNPLFARCGVCSDLIHSLKKRLSLRGAQAIWVDVPEMNLKAQLFFQSCGLKAHLPIASYRSGDIYRMGMTFRELLGGR